MIPHYFYNALEDIGIKELPGSEHHPRIIEFHSNTGKWSRDEVPWCGSAVETWLVESGHGGLGRRGALARSWLRWGVKAGTPELGDVCVLQLRKRGPDARTGSRGGYHVGLWMDKTRGGVVLLSGNTSDKVGVDFFPSRRWDVRGVRRLG